MNSLSCTIADAKMEAHDEEKYDSVRVDPALLVLLSVPTLVRQTLARSSGRLAGLVDRSLASGSDARRTVYVLNDGT